MNYSKYCETKEEWKRRISLIDQKIKEIIEGGKDKDEGRDELIAISNKAKEENSENSHSDSYISLIKAIEWNDKVESYVIKVKGYHAPKYLAIYLKEILEKGKTPPGIYI